MAQSAGIQKMGINHTAILDFLLANPTMKKSEVAAHFNVTQSWLSIVINSDAFKDARAKREDELFHAAVVPLRERVVNVAEQALERLEEKVEFMSADMALETTDKLLHRLGYAPNTRQGSNAPAAQNVTNVQNNFVVDANTLSRAQQNFGKASKNVEQERQLIEGESDGEQLQLPAAEEVQPGGPFGMGETLEGSAEVCTVEREETERKIAEGH